MARVTGSKSNLKIPAGELSQIFADYPKLQVPVSVGFLRQFSDLHGVTVPGLETADAEGAEDAAPTKATDKASFAVE